LVRRQQLQGCRLTPMQSGEIFRGIVKSGVKYQFRITTSNVLLDDEEISADKFVIQNLDVLWT